MINNNILNNKLLLKIYFPNNHKMKTKIQGYKYKIRNLIIIACKIYVKKY